MAGNSKLDTVPFVLNGALNESLVIIKSLKNDSENGGEGTRVSVNGDDFRKKSLVNYESEI